MDNLKRKAEEVASTKFQDIQLAVLCHNLPTFSAASLPSYFLYTLAARGRTGLNVEGMVTSTFLFGLMPGYLSYVLEGQIRSKDQRDFSELVNAHYRLTVDPDRISQMGYSLAGAAVGFILAIFKRPPAPTGPVPKTIIGRWAAEKFERLLDILITTVGIGSALGTLTYYGKRVVGSFDSYTQLGFTDVRRKLAQDMRLTDEQIAWLRQYTSIQFWCGVKAATTMSLFSMHECFWLTMPELRPYFPKMFSRTVAGTTAYGLLIGVPAIHGVLFNKTLPSIVKSRQEFYEGNHARAWNKHIACGALLGGSSVAVFIKRAPTSPVLKDFVRAGRFIYTPRNILTLGGASMLFGGGLGSAVFLARSAFTSWS
ncbi:hypothetical protein K523DRAFT_389801 [Schizophyllum commune Tattone D]|nr:hypothetical protein K523DRAFT_389801 [Schizophyllum commune Tattone D]